MVTRREDDGFMLLEVIVALVIVTIIMTALTSLFVNSITTTGHLRAQQSAISLVTSSLDQARSIGAVDAALGRGQAAVEAQFASFAGTPVAPWLASMDQVSSNDGYAADLPTTGIQQTLSGTQFDINYLVGTCVRKDSYNAASFDCTKKKTDGISYVRYTRVVAAVSWKDRACTGGTCYEISAVLLNGDDDPLFSLNMQDPPPPTLHACQNQVVYVGSTVDFAVFGKVQPDETPPICTLDGGVPTFLWSATDLPQGLTFDANNHITGTVTEPVGTVTSTVTVQDVYGKTSTSNAFTWTVAEPSPAIDDPGNQQSQIGTALSLDVGFTCPPAADPSSDPGSDTGGDTGGNAGSFPAGACTVTTTGFPDTAENADGGTPAPHTFGWKFAADPKTGLITITGTAPPFPAEIGPLTVTITAPSGLSKTTAPFTWTFTS